MGMRRLGTVGRAMDCLPLFMCTKPCTCLKSRGVHDDDEDDDDGLDAIALIKRDDEMITPKEAFEANKTLAFYLAPKTVVLKVSMHCNGCARIVEKHISKLEGVTSFQVDLESKKVVVTGDVTPFGVLESVSKIKFAELWVAP